MTFETQQGFYTLSLRMCGWVCKRLTLGRKDSEDRLFLGVSCQAFLRLKPTAVVKRSGVGVYDLNVLLISRTGPS